MLRVNLQRINCANAYKWVFSIPYTSWLYDGHRASWTVRRKLVRRFSHANPRHDDVIKWKHFPRYWPFVRGIHWSAVISPHKGQWRGALMFSMNCAWINGWVNIREAGDLRRHRAHHDVIVMKNVDLTKMIKKTMHTLHGLNGINWKSVLSLNEVVYNVINSGILVFQFNRFFSIIYSG